MKNGAVCLILGEEFINYSCVSKYRSIIAEFLCRSVFREHFDCLCVKSHSLCLPFVPVELVFISHYCVRPFAGASPHRAAVVNGSIRLPMPHLLLITTPEAQPTTASPVTASRWTFCSSGAPRSAPHQAQKRGSKATLRPQAAQNVTSQP